jgi:hypothetical protein
MYRQVGLRAVLAVAGGSSVAGLVGAGHDQARAAPRLMGPLAVAVVLQVAVAAAVVLLAVGARVAVQRGGAR